LLFPLGMGVSRLLKRSGDIPEAWKARLDALLGDSSWYDEFYRVERTVTLFSTDEEHVVKASTETIGRHFIHRLESIFSGVSPQPAQAPENSNNGSSSWEFFTDFRLICVRSTWGTLRK